MAARWDDLVRYVGLVLTTALGREVRQVLASAERTPETRRQALMDSLLADGTLHADLQIPDVARPLSLRADLRSRQVTASTSVDAPRDGTSRGRVSWLTRQLQSAPDTLKVETRIAGRSTSLAAPLGAAREDPSILYPEKGRNIRSFTVSATTNMGTKRDNGRGSFAAGVVAGAEDFYEQVLQRLRPWKASPPQLRKPSEAVEADEVIADLVGVDASDIAEADLPDTAPPEIDRQAIEEYTESASAPREVPPDDSH